MRRRTTTALVVLVVAMAPLARPSAGVAQPAAVVEPVTYRPPVDAEVVDTFRPPTTPYGAGNRGVDYATTAGQAVAAAADGEVVFAGRIGAASHVTILHADGLRTSYSFLADTAVRRGARVHQGDTVGTAGATQGLHFGARAGPTDDKGNEPYVDPLVLFGQIGQPNNAHAYLVADPHPTSPLSEQQERHLLDDALRGLVGQAARLPGWLVDRTAEAVNRKIELARILADDTWDLNAPIPFYLAVAALRWQEDQATCTPPATPTSGADQQQQPQRRIAILVGGLGSATGKAAVLDVDTTALGYAEQDVHQFSYRDDGQPYGPEDTQGDIDHQGARLAAAITKTQQQHPGIPVDVIAHSQGGLVARSAITTHHAAPTIVVTLGTPHQGTDLATAGAGLDATHTGHLALQAASEATRRTSAALDLNSTSIQQLSETSSFIRHLPEGGWPPSTHVVSIAARGDPIVPNHQSRLSSAHAENTVVTPNGHDSLSDHADLPGSPEATQEIRRAINGQPPTCRTLEDAVLDELSGRQASYVQDSLGAALSVGGLYVDYRTKGFLTPSPVRRR